MEARLFALRDQILALVFIAPIFIAIPIVCADLGAGHGPGPTDPAPIAASVETSTPPEDRDPLPTTPAADSAGQDLVQLGDDAALLAVETYDSLTLPAD